MRRTVGGNLIDYPGEFSTPTTDMMNLKLLLNSTISKPSTLFMKVDLENFYPLKAMDWYEYMWLPINITLKETIEDYNLMAKVDIDLSFVKYGEKYMDLSRQEFWQTNCSKYGFAAEGCGP